MPSLACPFGGFGMSFRAKADVSGTGSTIVCELYGTCEGDE